MTILDLEIDGSGNRYLRDRHFEGVTFADLNLDSPSGTSLLLERVTFTKCRTDPGTCWIGGDTTLREIVIDELECGDALRIDSSCRFERVVLRGTKRTGKLIITPGKSPLPTYSRLDSWCLDIREFYGNEVVVVGIPSDRIRFNDDRHVVIQGSWREELDWNGLGLSPLGFFGTTTKKLKIHGAETGVFSLPDPLTHARFHEEALNDLRVLRSAGIPIG